MMLSAGEREKIQTHIFSRKNTSSYFPSFTSIAHSALLDHCIKTQRYINIHLFLLHFFRIYVFLPVVWPTTIPELQRVWRSNMKWNTVYHTYTHKKKRVKHKFASNDYHKQATCCSLIKRNKTTKPQGAFQPFSRNTKFVSETGLAHKYWLSNGRVMFFALECNTLAGILNCDLRLPSSVEFCTTF